MVGDNRPRYSMSSPCTSVPGDSPGRTRKTCVLALCGSALQCSRGSAGTCEGYVNGVTNGEDELLQHVEDGSDACGGGLASSHYETSRKILFDYQLSCRPYLAGALGRTAPTEPSREFP